MKKILALFLTIYLMFTLIGCGCEDEVSEDKDEREEQGTDKSINTTEEIELKENQIIIKEQTEKDDENPKVIRRTYDWKGNLLSYSYDVKDMEGVWYDEECIYDEEDNLIKKVQSFSNGERIETEYTYEDGKMVYIESYSLYDEADIEYAECIYDGDNRIEQWHDSDGKSWTCEYIYDGDNCIKMIKEGKDYKQVTEYEYDDSGNCIKESYSDDEGEWEIDEYEYNKQGVCVKEKSTNSNGRERTTEYTAEITVVDKRE